MQLSITNDEGDIHSLELTPASTLEVLKAAIEKEMKIPSRFIEIIFNGDRLDGNDKTLSEFKIVEHSILLVRRNMSGTSAGSVAAGSAATATVPSRTAPPAPMSRGSSGGDNGGFHPEDLMGLSPADLALLQADPFSPEAQLAIAEAIRRRNVAHNLEAAMEYHPESFGRVTMLYVPVEVNKTKITAFVDSGAQATILSLECARRCNIMHLVDERMQGMARGVGTAKIVGRIHSVGIKIGAQYLQCSLTIMESFGTDMLFGLDALRRFQCNIDLSTPQGALIIHGEAIPFLAEHELEPALRWDSEGLDPKTGQPAWPEDRIAALVVLGVSRQEAIHALEMANGNADAAAGLLFGGF